MEGGVESGLRSSSAGKEGRECRKGSWGGRGNCLDWGDEILSVWSECSALQGSNVNQSSVLSTIAIQYSVLQYSTIIK